MIYVVAAAVVLFALRESIVPTPFPIISWRNIYDAPDSYRRRETVV